ncbi:MAG: DNA damage-inducible protein D [Alphaproteobacteria bacterium]
MLAPNAAVMDRLENTKHCTQKGVEYWYARDLQGILGYETWRRFEDALNRAETSLEASGGIASHHFVRTGKMVKLGSGAEREVEDYFLSRKACYLIAMNGDPAKEEIATAQAYFALQTHRMEIQDRLPDRERVALRGKVKEANKALNDAAQQAGVKRFGLFHDAGYRGLYEKGIKELRKFKRIGEKENPLDRAGLAELAANAFRITQTEQKITRTNIKGEQLAIDTHFHVGRHVRNTIKKIGGTLPENLRPERPIQEIEKRLAGSSTALPPKTD